MRFHTRKRRNPVVTIVSLIDILAILLIFFIVTTTFRKQKPALMINLPESKSAEAAKKQSEDPLVLRIKSENEITLDEKPVTVTDLESALLTAREAAPQRPVAMQADRDAPFGVVVRALDALKAAGVKNVPAFTQPTSPAP